MKQSQIYFLQATFKTSSLFPSILTNAAYLPLDHLNPTHSPFSLCVLCASAFHCFPTFPPPSSQPLNVRC